MGNKPRDAAIPPSNNSLRSGRTIRPGKAALASLPGTALKPRGWISSTMAIATLLLVGGLVAGGGWLSFEMIFDPDAAIWLNQYLPEWTRIPVVAQNPPQTLANIRSSLAEQGLSAGDPISLDADPNKPLTASEFLLPVLGNQPNCTEASGCAQIVELRVYQPSQRSSYRFRKETYYQLVNQLAIAGPEESFVVAPMVNARSSNQGSARALPLTTLQRFDETAPSGGVWLYLSGQQSRDDTQIAYGQILHYNPNRTYLGVMIDWTSPTGKSPVWQDVTGAKSPELVIDQSFGLEPQFKVYQLKSLNFIPDPVELVPVSLTEAALDHPTYDKAFLLARSGLWSPALQWFQTLKQQSKNQPNLWTAAVQAQMALVQLHAQVSQAQADQTWASPGQQVLTRIVDGRWGAALQTFQANRDNLSEIISLLKTDSGQLWRRVQATLKVTPGDADARAWGTLMVAVQQGKPQAIAWLKTLPKLSGSDARIYALLKLLDAPTAIANTDASTTNHTSQILGVAKLIGNVNTNDWLQPEPKTLLKLDAQQVWYRIQVANFYDGKRWQRSPQLNLNLSKAAPGDSLWSLLGLNTDAQMQITFWLADGQQQSLTTTVKAAQLNGNQLSLLAVGEPPPKGQKTNPDAGQFRPLAITSGIQWLQPGSITLSALSQQQPDGTTTLVSTLARILQKAGQLPSPLPSSQDLLEKGMGDWSVQQATLTESNQPDTILTLPPAQLEALSGKKSRGRARTLIFTAAGRLLYNEFGVDADQSFVAIADPGDGGNAALVVDAGDNYRLLRWSSARQRFE